MAQHNRIQQKVAIKKSQVGLKHSLFTRLCSVHAGLSQRVRCNVAVCFVCLYVRDRNDMKLGTLYPQMSLQIPSF